MGDAEVLRARVDLLRRRVLNVVGHELRTPMTTLQGLVGLLGTTDDPVATAEVHAAIQRATNRMAALIEDALVATGVATSLPVGDPEPTPVAATAAAAWDALEHQGPPPAQEGDAVVLAHPSGLRGALRAVLDNAAKYGSTGGGKGDDGITVRVNDDPPSGDVLIEVIDHGAGIPPAEADLLFEPFFRGERAVMRGAGLGLGLAVARALVEHDGGAVDVHSRDGDGTTTTIRLPAAGALP